MLNKIIGFIAKIAIGRQLVGVVNATNSKLTGKRTEVLVALQAILYILGYFKLLPEGSEEAVKTLSNAILGAIPVTLAEKVKKAVEIADKVLPEPQKDETKTA